MIVPTKNANLDVLNLSYKQEMGIKSHSLAQKPLTATITAMPAKFSKQEEIASKFNINVASLCNINRGLFLHIFLMNNYNFLGPCPQCDGIKQFKDQNW